MIRSKTLSHIGAIGAALTALSLLPGCAGMGKTPEQQVTERAQERLDLFVAGDFAQAYEYLSPGYRSSVTLQEYQRKSAAQPIAWSDAEVAASDCTENTCKLRISVEIVVFGAVPGASRFETRSAVDENWIKSGRTWYMVPAS